VAAETKVVEQKPDVDVEMAEDLPVFWVVGYANRFLVFNESWEVVAEKEGHFSKVLQISDRLFALVESSQITLIQLNHLGQPDTH
jgi:hypothetical protein